MQDFSTGTTVKNEFLPSVNATNPAKTGMLFSQRKLDANNTIPLPYSNNPMPCLYKPIYLGAYKDGLTALIELKKLGFRYTLGLSFNQTFISPDIVQTNAAAGTVTLIWNSATMGIQNLLSQNPRGSVTQGSATATLRSVDIEGDVSYMTIVPTTGSATFTTSTPVTVVALLDKNAPDPTLSDPVCCYVWSYFNQYVTQPKNATSPDLYISVSIAGRDSSISPTATAINLAVPTAVETVAGGINLVYPINDDNLGLLPSEKLGFSMVNQGAASGTYNGYTLTSTTCVINVINVSGTFDSVATVTVELDVSQNGFTYLGSKEISSYALCWNVKNNADLIANHPDYVTGLAALQAPAASKLRKYKVQGYIGYAFAIPNEVAYSELVYPDSTSYVATVTITPPTAFQYPALGGINAVNHMYMDLNSDSPYYESSGAGVVINQELPDDPSVLQFADQITYQGATLFVPNGVGTCYPYRNVNCLQTNGGKDDYEYRYQAAMLKARWLDKNAVEVAEATVTNADGTRKNNDPETIMLVQKNALAMLNAGVTAGMFQAGGTVTVGINPDDITHLLETINTSIVPANAGVDVIVVFNPYSI